MTISCNGSLPFFGYTMTWQTIPVSWPLLHNIVINVSLYVTPVYLVVGTFGNILSVTVFLRPAMSSLASRSRFILISTMDVAILYGCMLPIFLDASNIYGYCDLEVTHVNFWIQEGLMMTDAWVLVLVTFERTLAIFRPLSTWSGSENRKRCCSWINGILIALPFISLFLCLPMLFEPIFQMTILYRFAITVMDAGTILTTAVPFGLMLCLDIAILIKLYGSPLSGFDKDKENKGWVTRIRRRAIRKKTRSNPDSSSDVEDGGGGGGEEITQNKKGAKKRKENIKKAGNVTTGRRSARSRALQSVKMILVVDIVAILLTLPIIITTMLSLDLSLIALARFAVYTRHAINFIFYFISSQFRRETISVLCCCFRRSVSGGSSTTALSTITSRVNM